MWRQITKSVWHMEMLRLSGRFHVLDTCTDSEIYSQKLCSADHSTTAFNPSYSGRESISILSTEHERPSPQCHHEANAGQNKWCRAALKTGALTPIVTDRYPLMKHCKEQVTEWRIGQTKLSHLQRWLLCWQVYSNSVLTSRNVMVTDSASYFGDVILKTI